MRASHDAKNTDTVRLGVWKLKLRLCFIILQTERLVDRPFKFCNDHVISLRSPRGNIVVQTETRQKRGNDRISDLDSTFFSLSGRQTKAVQFRLKDLLQIRFNHNRRTSNTAASNGYDYYGTPNNTKIADSRKKQERKRNKMPNLRESNSSGK